MDWRSRTMIATALHLVVQRLGMMLLIFSYFIDRRRRLIRSKRKRGYSYSMLDRIPKQVEHMHDLVHINNQDCIDILRMDRNTFHKLAHVLEHRGGLCSSRYVNVQEQTALFLQTLAHHHKNRVVRFDFKRSGQTVSHYFNKTLEALCKIHRLILVKPKPIDANCTDDRWKSFKGCLGALDGTYINLRIPIEDQARYRSRKGQICTNVLGVVDPNMNFIYILAGWEGSCGDGRVLREALNRPTGLKIPSDNYYLCDLGYQNGQGFLTPYRNRRYHLEEWGDQRLRPQDKEEYFNMKHSRARNVIERAFGLLKIRWPILERKTHYSVRTQNRNIMACALLHNFIRLNMEVDPLENQFLEPPPIPPNDVEYIDVVEPSREWHNWRDNLATEMFSSRRRTRT